MTSIVELFPKCRKLAYDARQQVFQVQQGNLPVSDLYVCLDELDRQLNLMDELVYKETPSQRDVWKRKINELRQESQSIRQQASSNYQQRNSYQAQREELLRRRKNRQQNESDVGNLADESKSLEQSSIMVNSLIDQGEASLSGLVEQRQQLRGVKRLVMDIGTRLNLSQSTMRIIERRDITDAYLVLAGIVVTCIVIYFVWF